MAEVHLSRLLAAEAGAQVVEAEGSTVGAVLADLVERHPALATRVWEANGSLRGSLVVFVDGRDARYLRGLDTPVAADAEVTLLPAIGGGEGRR